MHLEIMIIWQFASIYIAELISSMLSHKSYILFAGIYVLSFCLLNQINLTYFIQPQHIELQMIIIPVLSLILSNCDFTFNNNFIDSLVLESFAASLVEETLFRSLIPSNFTNKNTGIIVSGILFAIIHIKSLNMNFDIIARIFITTFLFNIIMFQQKPNNYIGHFLWNFITITLVKTNDIDGTSITPIEISNNTIILLIANIIWNYITK